MKFYNRIYLIACLVLATGCFSDLDPKQLGSNSTFQDNTYKTVTDFKQGLAKLYGSFVLAGQTSPGDNPDISNLDVGFGVYLRAYWNLQELTTDEAVYSWSEAGNIHPLHWQTWTASNPFIAPMYYRIMLTVSFCNDFIRASAVSTDPQVKVFHAEARFLRALAYYHALDMFGNPPFVTELDKTGTILPRQTTRAALFQYIESELDEISDQLGAPRFEYGRADQAALWMLQAKLYLNAEVYVNENHYDDCITALNKVLGAGYQLSDNYLKNFRADNNLSTEIILPFLHDAARTQTYGGMTYIISGQIGGSMSVSDFGVSKGWAQNRVTKEFVAKFPDISGATDIRAQFYTSGQNLEIEDVGNFKDGYAIKKFKNLTFAGGPAPSGGNPEFVDTDFPMFRLADAYLMYAEAVLRGGAGGSRSTALSLVNALRTRAYGNNSGNIADADLTLGFILDERARELYWEGHRRTDLIRFGQFTDGTYQWAWKGNVKDGVATEAYRNLFPIPSTDIAANPTLQQNPGY